MANYTTTITNEGAALLASVIANQGTITFNEFRFSENDYTGQESTLTEGTFLGVFVTASAAASVIDSTTIKASAQFNNSAITGNHNLYSIGIVGTDGNTTALIAVCTTTDPDVIREPLTGTSTYAFNVNLSVSDTSQITVVGTTAAVLYDIDVVDTLISTDTDKPLSANQGRVLKGNVDDNFSGQSNENLLDNPWFTVNQRGATTITSGYGADRWTVGGGTEAVFSVNGVTLNSVLLIQYLENQLRNATYTVSVLFSDGTIRKGTVVKSDNTSTLTFINDADIKIMYITSSLRFDINTAGLSSGLTVRAVKLELGTVSTLANDVEPNYTTELLKCQRYFYRLTNAVQICVSFASSTDTASAILNLPVSMRATPTFSYAGSFYLRYMGANEPITNIAEGGSNNERIGLALSIAGNLTIGQAGFFNASNTSAYLDFSADL